MSLAEQIQRVDGSQNDILKKVLGAFGVTVGENKIDRLAALAKLAPLLKENSILSSDTRALYNLDTDAVPDDVLANLGAFRYGVGNEYVWAKQTQEYTVSLGQQSTYDSISTSTSVQYSNDVNVSSSGVTLKSPTTSTLSKVGFSLIGKYAKVSVGSISEKVLYITNVSVGSVVDIWYKETSSALSTATVGYVNSPNTDAYPPSVPDEYTYTPLGQLGSKVRIATGSYVGTGKYGSSNPNSLTFEFEPKILIVQKDSTNYAEYSKIVAQNGMKTANNGNSAGNNDYYVTFINWTHEVSWYSSSKNGQLNSLGTTYYYLALG